MNSLESKNIPQKLVDDLVKCHTTIKLSQKSKSALKRIARFIELRNNLLERSQYTENPVFAANSERIAGLWEEAINNALINLGSRVAGVCHE
jgi:hypothetical protein